MLASQGTLDTLTEEGHWGAKGGFLEEAVPLAEGQEWQSIVKGLLGLPLLRGDMMGP